MKAVKFEQCNITYAEDQPQYTPLPAYKEPGEVGRVITCHELTKDELEEVQKTGKVWLAMLTFNKPMQPVLLTAFSPFED